jgi:hypothetical protein
MPYSTLRIIQQLNNCYMYNNPQCRVSKKQYLPKNNQLNSLNANTNNPLNCIN